MIADFSLHAPDRGSDGRNHHAHVMLTMRSLTGDGFGNKNRDWNHTQQLAAWCEHWGDAINLALAHAGILATVDHRSYAEQGLNREPEPKQGPVATEMERQGRPSHAGDDRRAAQQRNAERKALEQEARIVALEINATQDQERQEAERIAQARKDEADRQRIRREELERAEQSRNEQGGQKPAPREQQDRKSIELQAAEQLVKQNELIDEIRRRSKQFREYLAALEQQAKAFEAERQRYATQAHEGGITESQAQCAQALQHHDIRDPFRSLARAAMSEHAMFRKEQQQLAKEIDGQKPIPRRPITRYPPCELEV